MNDESLCRWLKNNSSGDYRPSAEAANRIETLKAHLMSLRELIAKQDISVFGSKGNGEIDWSLRDQVIDEITQQINR